MLAAIVPLLRQRALRVLLIAAPGLTAAVAILTAMESNLGLVIVLNAAAGVIISSVLFIAISLAAHKVVEERVGLVRAAEQGFWRARIDLVSIQHEETGLYTDWYFRLRMQDEIERCRRYDLHFSVLAIKPLAAHQEIEMQSATAWFGERIHRQLRRADLAALLHDGTLAVAMPNTGRRAAQAAKRRIAKELAPAEPSLGLACYPDDGQDPDALLSAAIPAVATAKETAA